MHIITGIVLAALAGKNPKNVSRSPLLRLRHPVKTVHLLPGRVRFKIPALVNDTSGCKAIRENMSKITGLKKAEASPVTGSVLLLYDESSRITPELLLTASVKILGLDKELEKPAESLLSKEIREFSSSLNRAVYDQTGGLIDFWSAAFILMALFGIRSMATAGSKAFPAGFSMLWWATNGLMRGK